MTYQNDLARIQPDQAAKAPVSLLDYALNAASKGLFVFPLRENGTTPLPGTHGHLDATRDPHEIRRLWSDPLTGGRLDYNIGMSPRDGRFVCIDLDTKHGRNGVENFLALGGEIGGWVNRSKSGGLHVIYRTDQECRTNAGQIAEGVDVRGADGYLVGPGSTVDGAEYTVIQDDEPLEAPAWLVEKLRPYTTQAVTRVAVEPDLARNVARAVEIAKAAAPAISGLWHETGFKLGAQLCRVGLSPETAVAVLEEHWVPRGQGFKSRDQFERDVRGGFEHAARDGEHGSESVDAAMASFDGLTVVPPPAEPHAVTAPAETALQARTVLLDKLSAVNGCVLATHANLQLILTGDALLAGLFFRDEFACRDVLMGPVPHWEPSLPPPGGPFPRPIADADALHLLGYLQRHWSSGFSRTTLEDCLQVAAQARTYHPVRDGLAQLQWDRTPRIASWLTNTFGCESNAYNRAVGAKLLIAAVRRVRRPGTKFDYVPVLGGRQGIGKSSALRVLFGSEFFTDDIPADLGSKDAAIALAGVWAVELAEIESLIRSEAETAKAFLSRQVDRYRPPYGRRPIEVPRQCVLIGTTNSDDYLRDPTGNRRIWPVECPGAADLKWLMEHREQLWAEAAFEEAAGASIWLDDPEIAEVAAEAARDRMMDDPWDDCILRFLDGKNEVTVPCILSNALHMVVIQHDKRAQMRVASLLKRAGWKRGHIYSEGRRVKGWERVAHLVPPGK